MRATYFEFRHRWWVIFLIFSVAFALYVIDPKNCGAAIAEWFSRLFGRTPTQNSYRLISAFGTLLVTLAAFLRTWGTSYLREEVMRDTRVRTERLLADGPYRHVRNPLYFGNILMAVGIGLMASRIGFLVLAVAMTVFVIRLILREEAELLKNHGESYQQYCARVPMLIPSVLSRLPPAANAPNWAQGFKVELTNWLAAAAIGAFTVTLNAKLFWGIFAASLLVRWTRKPRSFSTSRNA
jgi:protein-S-isoprenylcysteine O-methyltransferase Ste14